MKPLKRKLASSLTLFVLLSATQLASAFYDPSLGRWLTRDPVWEHGFRALAQFDPVQRRSRQPQSIRHNAINNRRPDLASKPVYTYVDNDPVKNIDPRGLDKPGCDGIPGASETHCALEACAKHDKCFKDHGCNWTSWFELLEPTISECKKCNCAAAGAIIGCGLYDEGEDDETEPDYYCGLHDVFFDDPNSEHMNHTW